MFGVKKMSLFLVLIHSFPCLLALDIVPDDLQIKLDNGILQGNKKYMKNGKTYFNFQGIPYAVPPLGKLRFKDPIPYKKWTGILNATQFGSNCVEMRLRQMTYTIIGQEDCLYLNVYTPQNPHAIRKLLPVMVWVYGGFFREGSASFYGPDYLMNESVLIVTFNYRTGFFGFLSTQDNIAPGNYGLKDVVLALKWVKKNIIKFGGDGNKITVFGESAGAAMIGYMLISRQSRNLFHAAIMESGTPLCPWALHRNARKVAFDLGVALGLTTNSSSTLIRFLQSQDLLKSSSHMIRVNLLNFIEVFDNGGPFGPVIEPESNQAFLTKDSFRAFQKGDFQRIPVIVGMNSQESKYLNSLLPSTRPILFLYDVSPSSLARTAMNVKYPRNKSIVGAKIKQFYFKYNSFIRGTDAEFAEYFSDDLFVRPITKTAQLMSKYIPVYFYVYDFEGAMGKLWLEFGSAENNNVKGVAHATELWYLWKAGWTKQTFQNTEEELTSERLVKLWTNFATYGNPTPEPQSSLQNLKWPKVQTFDQEYLYIGKALKVDRNFKKASIQFWDNLYRNYSNGPFETY
ncbi:juvenile hormone esterase [Dendroctonus ponderosae]|uniref:juvenile hormone esterase n=1 Tax=Dendroctonus ponderosae TaxID=77166 RepID=UPI0020362D81|nr:juvenile hormone esterase [Dendroctonus ponderosae]